MRFAYPILILCVIGASIWLWLSSTAGSDPGDEALAFLTDIQAGNLSRAVQHFGGNTCRCPAKGGWGSYLIYASNQQPNLAFMVGHKFELGTPKTERLKIDRAAAEGLPWEQPDDYKIMVPLDFSSKTYSPLFLPLKMAYGYNMTEEEFNKFLKDPNDGAIKGLSLRLRSSLDHGAIEAPVQTIARENKGDFLDLWKEKKKDDTAGGEYEHPADPGKVMLSSGQVMPQSEVAAKLPHLSTAVLQLHVVRRGALEDWTVYHFGLLNPVLVAADGKRIPVTSDQAPKQEELLGTPGS